MTIPLNPRALKAIRMMRDAEQREDFEEAELVQDGLEVWVGSERFSARTVTVLLRRCLIRENAFEGGTRVYTLNEDGRKACDDPMWINPAIRAALGLSTAK